ncbi:MAG: transglutaminase-like domain-containing protein [Candidatus Woesearchaeota archaeon]|jgi:hypothetical protein
MQKKLYFILFSLILTIFLTAQTCTFTPKDSECYGDCSNGYKCNEGVCTEITPDTTSISITKTVIDDCPESFLLDESDLSPVTGEYVCKPILMDMVASGDLDNYLIDEITGVERLWDDWSTYQPLIDKVEELTLGLETEQEKVEAIANWVHISKEYSCDVFPPPEGDNCLENSPANHDADFTEIWESEQGVCLDAAIITTAMFRVAGIPAIEKMIGMTHIVTLYNIAGSWFQIDTTYCMEENNENCEELYFKEVENVEESVYFLYERFGHFQTENGEYCEYDFCMNHPFQTNKIMPLNDAENGATVYYPAIRNMYTSNGNQIVCSLEFKGFVCDASSGCYISATYSGTWNTDPLVSYEIEDMRNIGYNKIILLAYTSNEEYIGEVGEDTFRYRFACKEQTNYRLIAYTEFTLTPKEELTITYNDLIEGEDAEEGEFEEVVAEIKEVTKDIGISITSS